MTETAQQAVLVEKHGRIAVVSLNSPEKLNALGPDNVHELKRAVDGLDEDGETTVMVLTGKGRGFCSGLDLSRVPQLSGKPLQSRLTWPRPRFDLHPTFVLRNANFPVIGAINGVAAGAGFGLALACDLRIASEQAKLACVFMKRGLMPDFGLNFTLSKVVGSQKALELILTNATLDAEEALRLGIVLKVVPHQQLMAAAMELAEKIAKGPALAIAQTKRGVYRAESSTLESDLEIGSYGQQRCMTSEDAKEGAAAFFEKREPKFKGR